MMENIEPLGRMPGWLDETARALQGVRRDAGDEDGHLTITIKGSSREISALLRSRLLDGMLKYRAALHAAGLVTGFQWIDGSFLEHVEHLAGRAPNDVDIVTFYRIAPGDTPDIVLARNPDLFDRVKAKATFKVDAFLVPLDADAAFLVANSAYWYGVWSHRRDFSWKGFVEVDLTPAETPALDLLKTLPAAGATP